MNIIKELYGIICSREFLSIFITSIALMPINVRIIKSFLRKRDIHPLTSCKLYFLASLNWAVTWAWLEYVSQSEMGQVTPSKFARMKLGLLLLSLLLPSFILLSGTLFKGLPFKRKLSWGFELAITLVGLNLFAIIVVSCIILLFVFQMEFSHF